MTGDESQHLEFELPNVGRGSEMVRAGNLVSDSESLLVVLLGSHYCPRSRELVRALCERHDAFRRRATTLVTVLPDIRERARVWDRQYGLPFPMLVDPAGGVGHEGPSAGGCDTGRFGTFEPLQDSVADLPAFALCQPGEDGLTAVATETEATLDVPVVESLLGFVDRHRTTDSVTQSGNAPADS